MATDAAGVWVEKFKSIFGVIKALGPVLYCGYLAYYFFDVGGSVEGVEDVGLGPTVLGLGIVGLLFCIPLLFKIVKLISGPRSPGSGGDPEKDDDKGGFDADAAIARYMASRSAVGNSNAPIVSSTRSAGGSARPLGFGRRTR